MRFIILHLSSNTPLKPSEALPPELTLLLSPEVSTLSYSELSLQRQPEHPSRPGWRCCAARALSTRATLSLMSSDQAEEMELSLRFRAVAPPLPPELELEEELEEELELEDELELELEEELEDELELELEEELEDELEDELEREEELELEGATLLIQQLLSERLRHVEAQLERLMERAERAQVSPDSSWSPHELLGQLLTHERQREATLKSAEWASQLVSDLDERLKRWRAQPEGQRASILRLLQMAREQGLNPSALPAWLMTSEGCRAQGEVYREFLNTYDELSAPLAEPV